MAQHLAIVVLGAALFGSVVQAQTPVTPDPSAPVPAAAAPVSQANPSSPRPASGSVIPVQLTKTVDAKKAKAGDEIIASVTRDLKANGGELVIAKDTKIIGHVTQAQAHTKEQRESELSIAFDHAVGKSGDMTLPMSIQAIIAPPDSTPGGGAGGGYGQPATGGATATSPMGSRNGPMEGSPAPPSPSAVPNGMPTDRMPPINNNTQGVIGIPNLKLAAGTSDTQGSVLSSEKGNVKLESGTIILLHVN